MQAFAFTSYKAFVQARIKNMPAGGRGELSRIANALQMHTTSVSQVFRGSKDLTLEQAARLCRHWGLGELESDYFLNLVELERAGAPELKAHIQKRLIRIREQSKDLVNIVPKDRVLSEHERAIFYSNWYHSAVRLLCDIPEYRNIDKIAARLDLPLPTVNQALQFLLSCGLIVDENGTLKMGPKRTYIDASSPLISRHHANWRMKAIANLEKMDPVRDLALTAPMTLSKSDVARVREILVRTIEEIMKLNTDSKSEELHVLNIDWLKI